MAKRHPISSLAVAVDPPAIDVSGAMVKVQAPAHGAVDLLALVPAVMHLLASIGVGVVPPEAMHGTPQFLDVDQVAAALRVSRFSIYRWASADLIPSVRAGRKLRFELEAVVAALRSGAKAAVAPAQAGFSVRPAQRRSRAVGSAPAAAARSATANHADRVRAVITATRGLGM